PYLPHPTPNPHFTPHKPKYHPPSILITPHNFPSPSTRHHPPSPLKHYPFNIIIAASFTHIFYINSTKNTILP
ncbi:3-isopropylmalate dehydratase small subunit, partial [Staphylococcus epidermidis]